MKEVTSVLEFANAAAIERINYELVKVIENIQNQNTDEKPRKLTVELCLTPVNNRTTVNIKTTVKKQLRPTNAVHSQTAIALIGNSYQLVESGCGYLDGQADIFGEIHETEHTATLLQMLKKVSNIESVETTDDGITQQVVARQGAMLASDVKISPIVRLAPFRTFIEVEQPESEFLFRISDGNSFALYEADGGAWKMKAKQYIRTFFENALVEDINAGNVVIWGKTY